MAVDTLAFTQNNVTITFQDDTPTTPVTLTLTNDVSISIDGFAGRALNEIINVQRRGGHFALAHGQRVYPTVQIEFIHNGFVGATSVPGTPFEFVTFQGLYASNVSTTSSGTRGVKTFNVQVTLEATDYGGNADGSFILGHCYVQSQTPYTDGEPSTYSMTLVMTGDVSGDLDFAEA